MKKGLVIFFALLVNFGNAQNVGVGTATPESSAQLDVSSASKGFLPPRMTYAQRGQIASPAAGLTIWCADCDTSGQMQVFNGTVWTNMIGSVATAPILPYITICSQKWTKKNLDVTTYRNGDPIPKVDDPFTWSGLTTGAWCWYNNDSANYWEYGKLYNWYAVNDPRGLAPLGFHIPTESEWNSLANTCMGGVGGSLKEIGTAHWSEPNTGATNISGFTAFGSGFRNTGGTFANVGTFGLWWTSTQDFSFPATARDWALTNTSNSVLSGNSGKQLGFSVRCIKD